MQCMAQEGSEASVASSPPPPPPSASSSSTSSAAAASWWRDNMHPAAYGAWPPPPAAARWPLMAPAAAPAQHHGRTTSSGGADDDLSASNATMTSFTNTSTTNHSGLSMDSSVPGVEAAAAAAAAESHLWNQVLMGAGGEVGRSMQAVHDAHDDSENFLELLNSRTLAPELFAEPPACDYLKKMEYGSSHGGGGWPEHQFTAAALEKHLSSGYGAAVAHHHHHAAAGAPERLTANLSDLVSNWSIAPPNPCLGDARHRAGAGAACDNAAVAALGHGAKAGLFLDSGGLCKHEMGGHGAMLQEAGGGSGAGGQEFLRPAGYSSMLGLSSSRMYGSGPAMDVPWGNDAGAARSLSDLISFGGAPLGKPEQPAPTAPKAQAEYKKQGQEISSPAKTSSGGGSKGSSEGKKKRSEEQQGSDGNTKKSKNEASSPTSSVKASPVPKVKLGDKITALQQIVSPFGKTDTASVLYEAINYIKWLHEQVQLLSDPYMKTSSSKDYNAWGGLDRKEKSEAEMDLRSRGLCLVPVSCTPQVYRDNNGPDYWTPPYRSCLYR
ncbi:hypothetical protein GQ55_2G357800 [Panicum hallii var. hallii]|uniref:BHLH domain-containing protein n=2 Tax=Panicum hallii var. hallii TaxID=1504633 RepID=A0A2T7EVY7_9POAL|nr:hypothetical protein GQ55_2G357800 [Panicum hallii var. hallii]